MTTESGRTAAIQFSDLVWGKDKELFAATLWRDFEKGGRDESVAALQLALYDASEPSVSVNETLTRRGLARVSESAVRRASRAMASKSGSNPNTASALLSKLKDAEAEAHRLHLEMWAYGDPGGSDDEGEGPRR